MEQLDIMIGQWRDYLRDKGSFQEQDIEELESHLREEIDQLEKNGLEPDEAFLIAVKRIGNADALSREFSKVNTENLWKHLMIDIEDPRTRRRVIKELILIGILSFLAGTCAKIPEFFGYHLLDGNEVFYFKNISLFVLPLFAFYFVWKRHQWKKELVIFLPFLVFFCVVNFYPYQGEFSQTEILAGIHLPIVLWLTICVAYAGPEWRRSEKRMDFLRFSGETFLYTVLILCGGGVLVSLTLAIFRAIDIDISRFSQEYLMVYGGLAAPIVAAYLSEAKKSVVENLAPILARIFTPLFLVTMVVYILVVIVLKKSPYLERDFLIGFDVMLAIVLGLVVYVVSARKVSEKPNLFDYLTFALIIVSLVVDGIALSAIVFRLSSYGVSPNKVAALGENIVLLVNLVGLAWVYMRFFTGKANFSRIERWQTQYLPIYAIWASSVVVLLPIVFQFR